jgi:hypothetical protein
LPVVGQVPWHAPPAQAPLAHRSPDEHGLPSSHGAALSTCRQLPPLQLSSVQGLVSLQSSGVPRHSPPVHESPVVQASPSLQEPFVETEALSFAALSSVVSVVTLAPFVIGPEVFAVTSIRTVAFAPGTMSPRVQTTLGPPLQLPWLGVAERYDTEPGSGSRSTTLRATAAPRLSTFTS